MTVQPDEADKAEIHGAGQPMTDISGNPAAPFDFAQAQKRPGDDLGALREIHQNFVRDLCSSLAIPLRCGVSGEVLSIDEVSYGAFSDSLSSPTSLTLYQTPACAMPCMLEIGQELVSVILDLLMGGAGKTVATGSRELTPVEIDLLEKPLGIVARDLTRAWSPFVPGEFARTTSRFAQSVNRLESLLVIRMQLTVGEISGSLRLTVPPPLTRLVQRQSEASRREPRAASAESEQAIRLRLERELLVEVDCELHGSSIRLKDLIDLKVGTVLDLGVLCDGAITVCVNGRPKFRGLLTQAGSKMAVSVG